MTPSPSNGAPRRRLPVLAAALLLVICIAALAIYPQVKARWSQPLGPSLDLPTYTPTVPASAPQATPTAKALAEAGATPATGETSIAPGAEAGAAVSGAPTAPPLEPSATPPPADPTPQPLCGGPAVLTVLGIGADSGIDYLYGLGDIIRVARIDFVTPKVTMLSIPRDLWVELPPGVIAPDGNAITHSKLNQSYFYGGPGMGYYDGPGAGPGLMARTIDLNFGLRVDNYGAVNMQTFVGLVDAVGGIDIYLPTDVDGTPIDDKTEDMGYFYAGQQHFTGEEALRFARIRKRYNDFTRMDHQNMVMCALREKVLTPEVLTKTPQIIQAFIGQVLTDLSPEQISQLACLLPKIERENIIFTSLPDEIMEPGRVYSPIQKSTTFVMEADFDVIRDYVQRFQAGEWPTEPDEPTCP